MQKPTKKDAEMFDSWTLLPNLSEGDTTLVREAFLVSGLWELRNPPGRSRENISMFHDIPIYIWFAKSTRVQWIQCFIVLYTVPVLSLLSLCQ